MKYSVPHPIIAIAIRSMTEDKFDDQYREKNLESRRFSLSIKGMKATMVQYEHESV